jgi:hypothetical protein
MLRTRLPLALFVASALHIGSAHAGVFQHKTMHEEWSPRQVEQEYVLPRGWYNVGLTAQHKSTSQYRDWAGTAIAWEEGATWTYSQLWLRLEHGFSSRTTVYLNAPFNWARLTNDRGADIQSIGLGDIHTGIRFQPWRGKPGALAFRVDLKAPSGLEWPSNFTGGPDATEGFLMGTGATNLGLYTYGHYRVGSLFRAGLEVGWVFKFPAVTGYVVEVGGFSNGWLNPADVLHVHVPLTLQVADGLALSSLSTFQYRTWYTMGVSGEGLKLTEMFDVLEPAVFLDTGAELSWDASTNLGLTLAGSYQVLGGTTLMFGHLGLEELAPQPGLTLSLGAHLRW